MAIYNISGEPLTSAFDISGDERNICYDIDGNTVYEKGSKRRYIDIVDTYGYIGRWYDKSVNNAAVKVTNSSGSQVFFKVSGTHSITINIGGTSSGGNPVYYAYSIDDGTMVRTNTGVGSVIDLPDSEEHIVRLVIDAINDTRNRWTTGEGVYFAGVNAGTGTVSGVLPTAKVIFFYGDSITEGIRTLGTQVGGNSAINEYPWFCCENLGAIPYFIGHGSSGVIATGYLNTCSNAIDYFYSGVPVDNFEPDLCVINHGTNDPGDGFEAAYDAAINKMHTKYGTDVICLAPFTGAHYAQIRTIAGNYSWAHYVGVDRTGITFTDGVHPDAAGAKIAGERTAEQLTAIYGEHYFE